MDSSADSSESERGDSMRLVVIPAMALRAIAGWSAGSSPADSWGRGIEDSVRLVVITPMEMRALVLADSITRLVVIPALALLADRSAGSLPADSPKGGIEDSVCGVAISTDMLTLVVTSKIVGLNIPRNRWQGS